MCHSRVLHSLSNVLPQQAILCNGTMQAVQPRHEFSQLLEISNLLLISLAILIKSMNAKQPLSEMRPRPGTRNGGLVLGESWCGGSGSVLENTPRHPSKVAQPKAARLYSSLAFAAELPLTFEPEKSTTVSQFKQRKISNVSCWGRDLLPSIAIPQTGHRLGACGKSRLEDMVAIDVLNRRRVFSDRDGARIDTNQKRDSQSSGF